MTTPERPSRRIFNRIAVGALASAAIGAYPAYDHLSDSKKPAVAEAPADTPERLSEKYQTEALSFAKEAWDKLPSDAPIHVTPKIDDKGREYFSYAMVSIDNSELTSLQPGEKIKYVRAALNLRPGSGSLEISGTQDSYDNGVVNYVSTTIALDADNPALQANPDAPVTYKDYAAALNGVELDDVRSIIVLGEKTGGKRISGIFTPGQAPVFIDGKKQPTSPPSLETVGEISERVL